VLDNESYDSEMLQFLAMLRKQGRVRVERIEGAFNYSRLNNLGVELSRGSFVALLNNDVEVINYDWLSEMVSRATQPGVAMVGARLCYPNDAIQHGGVILGAGGMAGHAHVGLRRDDPGYFARAHLAQNLSAVTAACAVVKREVYLQLGGFDENLAVTFNDIDFSVPSGSRLHEFKVGRHIAA
jgi:GT2 family glycosyltransferase